MLECRFSSHIGRVWQSWQTCLPRIASINCFKFQTIRKTPTLGNKRLMCPPIRAFLSIGSLVSRWLQHVTSALPLQTFQHIGKSYLMGVAWTNTTYFIALIKPINNNRSKSRVFYSEIPETQEKKEHRKRNRKIDRNKFFSFQELENLDRTLLSDPCRMVEHVGSDLHVGQTKLTLRSIQFRNQWVESCK